MNKENLLKFLPGAAAGFTNVFIGHPFDTIKVRMQTGLYPHMFQCIKQTFIKEGTTAFYRGASIPFVSLSIKRSYQYYFYDYNQHSQYSFINNPFVSGAISGIIGTPIGCPMHVIKIRMQNSNKNIHKNLLNCIKHIYHDKGITGFYTGFKINMLKDTLYGSIFLGTIGIITQFQINNNYLKENLHMSYLFSLFKGGFAGCFTWITLFPFDSAKTMIQSGLGFNTFKKNVNKLGYVYMWRGITPVLIRTFPTNAISMLIYDVIKNNIQ